MSTRGLCRMSGSETRHSLNGVSDEQLEGGLRELIATGRRIEAQVVVHLMEVEARRLHLRLGYSSLFQYCLERLELSEYEAFSRINAARMAQKFPRVIELLEQHELNLTTLYLVRDYVCVENQAELFAEVTRKSKREVLLLLARRSPRADVPSRLRKLPGCSAARIGSDGALEPLSAASFRLQVTLSAEAKVKLELARDLSSHANPSGDLAVVVERALDALLATLQRGRFAATARRRGAGGEQGKVANASSEAVFGRDEAAVGASDGGDASPARRRHIPNEVRRQVVARDRGCCAFVGADGRRCGSRAFLQVHHETAFARGGGETVENLRLLCAAHNRLLAEDDFGKERVSAAIAARRRLQ